MWPQLGAPLGFLLANGLFLMLIGWLGHTNVEPEPGGPFLVWGWRIPFLLSAVMVAIGLYVRLRLTETPVFARALERGERVRTPVTAVFRTSWRELIIGTFVMLATYTLFYTVATLVITTAIILYGASFGLMLAPDSATKGSAALFLIIGMTLMGLSFGPMSAVLPELFPTNVRYTGSGISYNVSGILGAAVAPFIATWLATKHGVAWVGVYLIVAAILTVIALLLMPETKDISLENPVGDTAHAG